MYYILMIDDEPKQLEAHQLFLKEKNCSIDLVSTVSEALRLLSEKNYHVILLDAQMPSVSGYTLCSEIKNITKTPVIFLSNHSADHDQVLGFHAGGSDYISKDSSLELFWARISACLSSDNSYEFELYYPPLLIDKKRQRAFIEDNDLLLTQTEFLLLSHLALSPNKIWSVQALYREIWGEHGDVNPVLVQMHISRMRSKLEKAFPRHEFIETVWGKGYQFVPSDGIIE